MNDMLIALIWTAGTLAAVGTICFAGLKAWRGWLDLKRHEIAADRSMPTQDREPAARIEMADLKERLRKLEAIARGVDL